MRLVLNQIGRRLTERLDSDQGRKHQLLMMLDEFPALGRLDFFETALAFMAGYGIRAFLIAQSLNQISKAYGENNSILDNCHVRVCFATNDERTAKRISDALGTATEQRAMRNYAGHRLSPWLAHVMVSRQETARALLTPGEVMQLPADDELVLVSGLPPVRAKKLRYYEDSNFKTRLLPAPGLTEGRYGDRPKARPDDWTGRTTNIDVRLKAHDSDAGEASDSGVQQERYPGQSEETIPAPAAESHVNPCNLDEDTDPAADKRMIDRVSPLAPVIAARAINEGADRNADALPSF